MYTVYRVQHRTSNVGPFQTVTDFTQELARKASERQNLPHPGEDGLGLGNLPYCYVFGCFDIESLRQWFLLGHTAAENENIVRTLAKLGFVLAEYLVEASDCRVSTTKAQVAFYAGDAEEEGLVQFHAMSCLLDESPTALSLH